MRFSSKSHESTNTPMMKMEPTQPDYQKDVQRFHSWVRNSCDSGIQDPAAPEKTHPFLPHKRIDSYFRDNNFRELDKILDEVFEGDSLVDAEIILRSCARVFCILLSIGKARYIQYFIQHEGLHDQRLPFDPAHGPAEFPVCAADERFLQTFCEKQWTFCAKPFERNLAGLRIPEEQVLPITKTKKVAGGGSAVVHKIVLHDQYNHLNEEGSSPNFPKRFANTFILKTYRTNRAEKYYNNEIEAFRRLRANRASAPAIIGFYGSFMKGETYNVLLEYADQSTLEDYFQTQEPPASGEEILKFWIGLFQTIRALINIHGVPPSKSSDQNLQILRGWHQDVKPANILVVSNYVRSPYEWQFKLGDLGLSHFRKVALGESNTDIDAHGTRAYGAPECYRPDEVMHDADLKVLQNVDIWSLGCVFSEAAVWVAYGYKGQHGLEAYRRARKEETDKLSNFKDGDCFHDGEKKLKVVGEYHEKLLSSLRAHDYVTKSVLDLMVDEMLEDPGCRPTATNLWGKVRRITDKANAMLARSNQPPTIENTLVGGIQPRRMPPVWPTSPPPTNQRHTWGTQKPGEHIGNIGGHCPPSASVSHRGMTESPVEYEGEEEDAFSQWNSLKGKSIAQNHPSNTSTRETGQKIGETSFHSERKSTSAPFDEGRLFRTPSGKKQVHDRLSITTDFTDILGSNSRPTVSGSPNIKNNARSHGPPPFDQIRNSHHLNETSTLVLPTRRPTPAGSMTSSQLPHLSIHDAMRWKAEKKQKGLFRKRHEPRTDFYLLDRLIGRDHVFLIDDSSSMKKYWTEVREVCETLAYMVKEKDPNGFDVYFTVDTIPARFNYKHTSGLEKLLEKKRQRGVTDMKLRLNQVFADFKSNLSPDIPNGRFRRLSSPQIRPTNLYVLTDGLWDQDNDPAIPIKDLVNWLVQHNLETHHFMIQFITFGTGDLERLERLDSGLNLPLDIVDTVPSNGNVWKMLFGSTHRGFDAENETPRNSNSNADDFTDATTLHEPAFASPLF